MTYPVNQHYGSYTQNYGNSGNFLNHMARPHRPPPPQNYHVPQQQFGIVGHRQFFSPPPAISYGSAYSSFTPGNASFNKVVGTIASAISGILYSNPTAGGYIPGQLGTNGGSVPYLAWSPPGGGFKAPSHTPFFISQAPCSPPQYKKMGMGW